MVRLFETPMGKYVSWLPLGLLLAEVPNVQDLLQNWRHALAILGAVVFVIARLSPHLRRIYNAVVDIDNPKAGVAKQVAEIEGRIEELAKSNENTLAIAKKLLHTHEERVTVDELMSKFDTGFGELTGLIKKTRDDIKNVASIAKEALDRVTSVERRVSALENGVSQKGNDIYAGPTGGKQE